MIALTQENRDELIAYANAAIKECDMHGEDYTPRPEMMIAALKVALASLTAEPIGVVEKDTGCFFKRHYDKSRTEPVFTAPPVPEIKIPSIEALAGEYKYQVSPHDIVLLSFALNVIKRLNGLGE